jgi:hypothetical protein
MHIKYAFKDLRFGRCLAPRCRLELTEKSSAHPRRRLFDVRRGAENHHDDQGMARPSGETESDFSSSKEDEPIHDDFNFGRR